MRVVTKKVYYCEYCNKKKGLHPHFIKVHEKGCTMNPDRVCGMCGRTEPLKKLIAKYLIDLKFKKDVSDETFEKMKKEIGCPACILALLRQTNTLIGGKYFDFKTERIKWWQDKADEERQAQQSMEDEAQWQAEMRARERQEMEAELAKSQGF